ncbi:MAG: 30S ribosomal protein S12 methylthiotransferase RimO [Solitalea-like symbiont of Tyrophagus putrescentiae]
MQTVKNNLQKKISIISLGCAKNLVDSETLFTQIKSNNIPVYFHENDDTLNIDDIVIINTCGFIGSAKEESINTILHYINLKKLGKLSKVFVMGCLSQLYGEELKNEIPEIDSIFGHNQIKNILQDLNLNYRNELYGERIITTPSHFAFLKIAEGCNRPCSFCSIPKMRGVYKSKTIETIVEEAQFLASKNVKELILIAQDLTFYGKDIYNEIRLTKLLEELVKIKGIEWIRLHYLYPSKFPMDLIDFIASNNKICNYIDMPIQHISDNVLKSMRRGISKRKTIELLETIKKQLPNAALRTTLISGYPNETDADHKELLNFIQQMQFDRLGVFTYSREEHTTAYDLNYDLEEELKRERMLEILDIQKNISLKLNQRHIDEIYKIIIDTETKDYFIGRTEFDSPDIDSKVFIKKNSNLDFALGNFYNLKIKKVTHFDLYV